MHFDVKRMGFFNQVGQRIIILVGIYFAYEMVRFEPDVFTQHYVGNDHVDPSSFAFFHQVVHGLPVGKPGRVNPEGAYFQIAGNPRSIPAVVAGRYRKQQHQCKHNGSAAKRGNSLPCGTCRPKESLFHFLRF